MRMNEMRINMSVTVSIHGRGMHLNLINVLMNSINIFMDTHVLTFIVMYISIPIEYLIEMLVQVFM